MRIHRAKIGVLMNNTAVVPGLIVEHGLSFFLEADGRRLLFDSGASDALFHNAERLGISLTELDAVVLSHGHYDHTGGLAALAARASCPPLPVYAHRAVQGPHYSIKKKSEPRDIGLTESARAAFGSGRLLSVDTEAVTEIIPGVFCTGAIPRITPCEDEPTHFFFDPIAAVRDPVPDDQALFFDTRSGLVILLGCTHAGVINTLLRIRQLRPNRPLHTVIGGMHLLAASSERLNQTAGLLNKLKVSRVIPLHCTGTAATEKLRLACPSVDLSGGAGFLLDF